MFGFPTRVRPLVRQRPQDSADSTRSTVSDRSLDQAVSMLRPARRSSATARVHTVAGFAAWSRTYNGMKPVDPLGPEIPVGRLRRVPGTARSTRRSQICQICGAGLRMVPMHQPAGFRTTYRERDYSDENDESTGAGAPAISVTGPADTVAEGPGSHGLAPSSRHSWCRSTTTTGGCSGRGPDDGMVLVDEPALFADVQGGRPRT